jgi:hypothetical protein
MNAVPVLQTSRPRAGRRFAPTHELALVEPALAACRQLPGAAGHLLVLQEMTGPIGIPDLTALVGDESLIGSRLTLRVPPLLHQVDAAVAAVAHPSRARSAGTLARMLNWPEDTVSRRLSALLKVGALTEVKSNRFVRPGELQPLGRLYAVEAKVANWSQALRQARSYSVWADAYVIVLGSLSQRSAVQLHQEVTMDRGGLIVAGRWVRRPAVRKLSRARRLWAAEHLVAALLGPSSPSFARSVKG